MPKNTFNKMLNFGNREPPIRKDMTNKLSSLKPSEEIYNLHNSKI